MGDLREELAAVAARLIIEDGLDYATAKRKAMHQLFGASIHADVQPDNADIQAQVQQYLTLFHGKDHPMVLWTLRRTALELMEEFAEFRPHLAGAVWNGTATEHSALHLLLFTDDAKAVEIHCINHNIVFRVGQAPHYAGKKPVERLDFEWPLGSPNPSAKHDRVTATLSLYPQKDERGVLLRDPRDPSKMAERGSLQALRAVVAAGPVPRNLDGA